MELQIRLNEDEHQDIKINDNMVINIHRGDVGYVIDVYNTNDDLLCTNSIWDDDLDPQPESGRTHACDTISEQEDVWQDMYKQHPDTVEELIVSAVREDCEKHYNMELTDADWQKIYTKCTDVKRAEALKEAYRELKEEAENAMRGERYLDEVAEAASEQYDKAMEWCKQQQRKE